MKRLGLVLVLAISALAQPDTSGRLDSVTTWQMVTHRQGNLGWITRWDVYTTDTTVDRVYVEVTFRDGTSWETWAPVRIRARDNVTLAQPEVRAKFEDIQSVAIWVERGN
jgi:hypothetical protein